MDEPRLPERSAAACLRAAVAAPSIHNTQPWRFRFDGAAFDVFTDPSRALAVVDPHGRARHISVGAAVCNLRLALAAEGWASRLERGGPDGAAARIVPADRREAGPEVRALAAVIARRRTNRGAYEETPVPDTLLSTLRRAAAADGVRLVVLDPVRRGAVLALTQAADAWQRADPRYHLELARWTSDRGDRRDGVAAEALGPRPTTGLPVRDFGVELPAVTRDAARFERHPLLLVLHTRGDDPRRWLNAGRALQRVLLTAALHGLAAQPMTQALEVAHLRPLLAPPGGLWSPQMILRIGFGRPVATSVRRPVREVLLRAPGVPLPPSSTAYSRTDPALAGNHA